jgi:hypothetical protein
VPDLLLQLSLQVPSWLAQALSLRLPLTQETFHVNDE